jgi:site-specific DNA-methyltransferase (adenine-specific)
VIDLRLGRWEDVLADVERVDAVITDPPFSLRQHAGYVSGSDMTEASRRRLEGVKRRNRAEGRPQYSGTVRPGGVPYAPLDKDAVARSVCAWLCWEPAWILTFGDHITQAWWRMHLEAAKWYTFAPVVWVKADPSPRFQGDGPASACEYITVSRPRRKTTCGSLPGYYFGNIAKANGPEGKIVTGQKPLWLMRAIIRDYTKPGDVVCDPYAGGGTTLLAAAIEGRSAIGAEMDEETHEKAKARLDAGYTPNMFATTPAPTGTQGDLL